LSKGGSRALERIIAARVFEVICLGKPVSSLPITEADTCRKYVLPKLYEAGWTDEQISEQKTFTRAG